MVGPIIAWLFGREEPSLAEKYRQISQQTTSILDAGAVGTLPEELKKVNYLQRELSDLIIYPTEEFFSFFTPQRVDEAYQLLQQASAYLQGSDYQEFALERSARFLERIRSKKRAEDAYQALLQKPYVQQEAAK